MKTKPKKRDYPMFIIDNRLGRYNEFYVVCLHKECGFIASLSYFKDDASFLKFVTDKKESNPDNSRHFSRKLNIGGVILQVDDFLFSFDEDNPKHRAKSRSLLKKGLDLLIYGETKRVAHGELDIDNQIKQQELTIERAKSTYDELIERCASPKQAEYTIALAEATLETLKKYKAINQS